MTLEGRAPELKSISLCTDDDYKVEGLCPEKDFFVESDFKFDGKFTLQIKVAV